MRMRRGDAMSGANSRAPQQYRHHLDSGSATNKKPTDLSKYLFSKNNGTSSS